MTLNALAQEGNQAARLLLSSSNFEWFSREDTPDLGFRERREFFKGPRAKPWRKDRDAYDYPLGALESLDHRQPAEAWLKAAKAALAAGERERVLYSFFNIQFDESPYLAEFLSEIVTLDDYEQAGIWLTKQWGMQFRGSAERLGRPPSPKWDLNWKNDPWTEQDEAAFQAALADARLAAIMHQEYFNTRAVRSPEFANKVDLTHQRSAQILDRYWPWNLDEEGAPTPEETRMAGELLVNEANHSSRLWPIRDFCQQHCPNTLPSCLYSGFVAVDDFHLGTLFDTPIEALIPQRRWHASRRARDVVMNYASDILAADHDQDQFRHLKHIAHDQCLISHLESVYGEGR
ncbi:MAG: hypothetical protein AAGE80_16900 [Pseudomonadota bacterium]